MKIPIIISMLLLILLGTLSAVSVYYEVKRPVYSSRLKRLSRKIFIVALFIGGIGIYLAT